MLDRHQDGAISGRKSLSPSLPPLFGGCKPSLERAPRAFVARNFFLLFLSDQILLPSLSDQTTSSKPDLMDERVKLLIGRQNLKYLDMQIVHGAIQKEIALKVSSNHSNWNKIQSTLWLIPHSEDENNANTFHAAEKERG